MAVTVQERYGRVLNDGEAELTYLIRGTTDDVAARTALADNSPALHGGMPRDQIEVEEIEGVSGGAWIGRVTFAPVEWQQPAEPEPGQTFFSFETGGATQHTTQSLQTIATYPDAALTPRFDGAIGVGENGVEGVDVEVPSFSFSVTYHVAPADMTSGYVMSLYNLTGKVNNAPFAVTPDIGVTLSFAAGEVLFRGASGSKRPSGNWEIVGQFAASPNETGLSVGSITGIEKKGWEYLWVLYDEVEDQTVKSLIQKPVAAYVEQVYKTADFAVLSNVEVV